MEDVIPAFGGIERGLRIEIGNASSQVTIYVIRVARTACARLTGTILDVARNPAIEQAGISLLVFAESSV